jgi:hypothetical protein
MLRRAGVSYNVIPLHGRATGGFNHWGVCETQPVYSEWYTSLGLVVARGRCGAS